MNSTSNKKQSKNAVKPLKKVELEALQKAACLVRKRAYAPYSKYKVGAAILSSSGKIYKGCNVENASYGATICAERSAVLQMIASGDHEIVACAIATKGETPASPCGMCRQVLAEFGYHFPVYLLALSETPKGQTFIEHSKSLSFSIEDLLPRAFRPRDLDPSAEAVSKSKNRTTQTTSSTPKKKR